MFTYLKIFILSLSLLFVSCSSMIHKKNIQLSTHNKTYAISSFWNYTETSMAGLRAASIVESVLTKENLNLVSFIDGDEKRATKQNKIAFLAEQLKKAKALNITYLVMGEVQEWRYKTGIDGEPVVSYSIKIIEVDTGKVLFNSVGAKSGWGHKSIGVVAQEIASELIPQFIN